MGHLSSFRPIKTAAKPPAGRTTKLNKIIDEIVSVSAYVDTVEVYSCRYLTGSEWSELIDACDGRVFQDRDATRVWTTNGVQKLILQRPRREALEVLIREHFRTPSRIDFAVDLNCKSRAVAQSLCNICRRCLIRKWGRRGFSSFGDVTTYDGPKSGSRVCVIYADKPSKVTGLPCVHIELRFYGSKTISRAELRDILPLIDIIGLFRRAFLARELDIQAIGRLRLPRSHWNDKRSNISYDRERRAGYLVLRVLAFEVDKNCDLRPSAALLRRYWQHPHSPLRRRKRNEIETCLVPLEIETFFPRAARVIEGQMQNPPSNKL